MLVEYAFTLQVLKTDFGGGRFYSTHTHLPANINPRNYDLIPKLK